MNKEEIRRIEDDFTRINEIIKEFHGLIGDYSEINDTTDFGLGYLKFCNFIIEHDKLLTKLSDNVKIARRNFRAAVKE